MLESEIESRLYAEVKKRKGIALKLIAQFFTGLPDRLILIPYGKLGFIELKQKGKKPSPRQRFVIKLLLRMGFKVFVLDDINDIKKILDEIEN